MFIIFQNKLNDSTSPNTNRLVVAVLVFSLSFGPSIAHAQSLSYGGAGPLNLPAPGQMITTTSAYVPPMLKGMKIGLENPFAFDFILDSGDVETQNLASLRKESEKLIKYFLASLTIPEDDLWVNLSPYEKDRIVPDEFGITQMGRDLLAQDYILKQLTASLIYPEKELGKRFWDRIWKKVGAQNLVPVQEMQSLAINTFNKVWIVPDKAVVYEDGNIVFVLESHLKVMLEEDYRAMAFQQKATAQSRAPVRAAPTDDFDASTQIIRELIIPEIEKEVNEGAHFAPIL